MINSILVSSDLSKLRSGLVKIEDEGLLLRRQKELAELATNPGKFVAYFRDNCKTQELEEKPPPPYGKRIL